MLIKFFARGSNGGDAPVNYVMATENRENMPPVVLRDGNPEMTRELINNIDRKWAYTSGVISFAIEDNPTEEQQLEVIERFEKAAFAGLEENQYNILWVRHQHTEGNRVELHFVTPRMELNSGKALNIAPPQWQKLFNPLQTILNLENEWANPLDPERAQVINTVRESEPRARTREEIGNFIHTLVESGELTSRQDIIEKLAEIGLKTNREGKDYISVKDTQDPDAKPFRLKGKYYEQDWKAAVEHIRENTTEFDGNNRGSGGSTRGVFDAGTGTDTINLEIDSVSKQSDRAAAQRELKEVGELLDREVSKRREFNKQSYPTISVEIGQPLEDSVQQKGMAASIVDNGITNDIPIVLNGNDLSGSQREMAGIGAIRSSDSGETSSNRGSDLENIAIQRNPFDLTIPDPFTLFIHGQQYGAEISSNGRGTGRRMENVQSSRGESAVLQNEKRGIKANDTNRTATFNDNRGDVAGLGTAFFRFKEWLRAKFERLQELIDDKLNQFIERERTFREQNEQLVEQIANKCSERASQSSERTTINDEAFNAVGEQSAEIDNGVQQLQSNITKIDGSVEAIVDRIKEITAQQEPEEPYYSSGMSM